MYYPDGNPVATSYPIPYGWPGFIGNIVNIWVLVWVVKGRSPLWPWRKLQHHRFNNILGMVQLVSCAVLIARCAFSQCKELHGVFFLMASLFVYLFIVTIPLTALVIRTEAPAESSGPSWAQDKKADTEQGRRPKIDTSYTDKISPSNTLPNDGNPVDVASSSENDSDLPAKRPQPEIRIFSFRGLFSLYFANSPTVHVMIGTYSAMKCPTIDQTSFQVKLAWWYLFITYTTTILSFALALVHQMYLRYRVEGWPGVKAVTVLEFNQPRKIRGWFTLPTPWLVAGCAGVETTFLSNWVMAMAAGGNGGFPEPVEGNPGLLVAYWAYFVLSKVTLFAI
ncbi:hypothetical protein QBC34DRAFT_410404 [Podospora aff. communis PSN243]|uniref:Uncharacterized protein n=1 Tax=Podospora aff. communis PSN243 TaxID=3040156 RepID=A0AAV9GGN4_9PEZI|nr:hypothetical protein QBC34DRAFT_410404 [Podospora aff. communis PSN243]